MESRHILVITIDAEAMPILFRTGAMLRCMAGVPPDARLLSVSADWLRQEFQAMFEHPSFPLCSLGCEPERRRAGWEIVEHPQASEIDAYPRFIGTEYQEIVRTERGRRRDWEG